MPELNEIDYRVLIDRLITDFPPAKRLFPVSIRLGLWILLEAAILALAVQLNRSLDFDAVVQFDNYGLGAAGFIFISVAAAWIALRNSIPGRESGAVELIMLAFGIIAAASMVRFELPTQELLSS